MTLGPAATAIRNKVGLIMPLRSNLLQPPDASCPQQQSVQYMTTVSEQGFFFVWFCWWLLYVLVAAVAVVISYRCMKKVFN